MLDSRAALPRVWFIRLRTDATRGSRGALLRSLGLRVRPKAGAWGPLAAESPEGEHARPARDALRRGNYINLLEFTLRLDSASARDPIYIRSSSLTDICPFRSMSKR